MHESSSSGDEQSREHLPLAATQQNNAQVGDGFRASCYSPVESLRAYSSSLAGLFTYHGGLFQRLRSRVERCYCKKKTL